MQLALQRAARAFGNAPDVMLLEQHHGD